MVIGDKSRVVGMIKDEIDDEDDDCWRRQGDESHGDVIKAMVVVGYEVERELGSIWVRFEVGEGQVMKTDKSRGVEFNLGRIQTCGQANTKSVRVG